MQLSGYDYIVVGAGSAGAALAARLSQTAASVLLLEAGPDWRSPSAPPPVRAANPMTVFFDPWFAEINWPGVTARRSAAQQPTGYLRGKGLGGSSTINGQFAIRGVPEDFDRWEALGCTGWSWTDVLPALCRLERDLDFPDADYHGSDGPIPIRRNPLEAWGAVDLALREAALDEGYGWDEDHNAPGTTGVSPYAFNADETGRVTTNDGYLEPARDRPNLTIRGGAHVDRVCLKGSRAHGVALAGGEVIEGTEVVLSSGAVHSPCILLRSGIGPEARLRELGVPVVADLPVGEGLQDHAFFILALPSDEPAPFTADRRHSNCCVRYSSGLAGAGPNDMFIACMNYSALGPMGIVGAWVNQVESRGRIELHSADPFADPVLEIDMLSHPSDLARIRDASARLQDLLAHPAFAKVLSGPPTLFDGTPVPSGNELEAALLRTITDAQHATGTCRMGDPADERAVVDHDGRVLGIDGLRVADASVFPEIPRANTHVTAVMVGEHIAARMTRGMEV